MAMYKYIYSNSTYNNSSYDAKKPYNRSQTVKGLCSLTTSSIYLIHFTKLLLHQFLKDIPICVSVFFAGQEFSGRIP